MRQIREVLRLKNEHQLTVREIARSCVLPPSTVGDYLQRAAKAGLGWPLPATLTDELLQERLLGSAEPAAPTEPERPTPDWARVREELGRKGVTLRLLWKEYKQEQPQGYGYSRFCELYGLWAATLDPTMRQTHEPGEQVFVDWAGDTVPIYQADGTVAEAAIFVAVLGASNLTFAQVYPDQSLASWIAAHVQAFAAFEGVPKAIVPDNTKTAVTEPCRYEPRLHRSYQEMAAHYRTIILPARVKKPRDKSKVEGGVLIVQRQILAALRDQKFFSLSELSQAVKARCDELNAQPFQKLVGSRRQCFQEREKPALLPLPATPYELAYWSGAKANIDYHVVVDKHYYSVPHTLIHQPIDVRTTATTIELFHRGQRVAAHARSSQPGLHTTTPEHRPKSHQKYLEWTPGRIVQWAQKTGPQCGELVREILAAKPHPEQGFRSCLGIIRLGKGVGSARLEAACARARHFGTCSYRSVKSILASHLDAQPLEQELPLASPPHDNVRGGDYYV